MQGLGLVPYRFDLAEPFCSLLIDTWRREKHAGRMSHQRLVDSALSLCRVMETRMKRYNPTFPVNTESFGAVDRGSLRSICRFALFLYAAAAAH